MDVFFRDTSEFQVYTWNRLINDINCTEYTNKFCYSKDFYDVFLNIILTVVKNKSISLLDSDLTDNELTKISGINDFDSFKERISSNINTISNKDDLIKKILENKENSYVTLYTSGTTGKPKQVQHPFANIFRNVKISESNKKAVWGFAYNPTHIAGLQVLFQAIFNGNEIIRLFGLPPGEVISKIEEFSITHISATPTFFRQVLNETTIFPKVKRITTGGEKLDDTTYQRIRNSFPNAKFNNIFAMTETGTLFTSKDSSFELIETYRNFVKIENNELLIHSSLLGKIDIEIGEWYNTGDIVEQISSNPLKIKFINRKSEIINIGGYNVNPQEVEEILLSHKDIIEAQVYSKSNKMIGNVLLCDIVSKNKKLEEFEVRLFLQKNLQEYKIPRIINFKDKLELTRTGKINRKK